MKRWASNVARQFQMYMLHQRSLPALSKWQEAAVRRLFSHAGRTVPMWRDAFLTYGIDPSTMVLADIAKLPVSSKDTYRGRMTEEYIDNSRPLYPLWRTTSGSSGEPFSFLSNRNFTGQYYDDFLRLRFLLWKGHSLRSLARTRVARIKMSPESRANRLFIPVASYREDPGSTLQVLADFKPDVLESYATVILDVVHEAKERSSALSIPYVISYGEILSPATRHHIEEVLGAEVFDRYGIEEVGVLAVECDMHDGQHMYGESVLIEIVDERGRPVPPGTRGRVVVTDLLNYAMPFIRYDTGDQGVMSLERCPCGLHMPRVWINGRYSAFLSFPGRGRIHHLEFDGALNTFMHAILQYQIVKEADDRLKVRVVPAPGFSPATHEQIVEHIQALTGSAVEVKVERVAAITRLPRGKSQTLRDESI